MTGPGRLFAQRRPKFSEDKLGVPNDHSAHKYGRQGPGEKNTNSEQSMSRQKKTDKNKKQKQKITPKIPSQRAGYVKIQGQQRTEKARVKPVWWAHL